MKKILWKLIISCVLVYSLVFVSACPRAVSIDKARSSSAKLAAFANEGVNITRELFRAEVLKPAEARIITEKFITLARAGIAFDLLIKQLERDAAGKTVAKTEIERLFKIFSSEVVAAFLDVLKAMKISTGASHYAETLELLRMAILVIARAFSREPVVARQLSTIV